MDINTTIIGISQYLIDQQQVNSEQILHYQQIAQDKQISLIRCLLENKIISAKIMAELLSNYFNLPFLDLDLINSKNLPANLLTENILRTYNLLPILELEQDLHVATDDPSQYANIQALKFYVNKSVILFIVESDKLQIYIKTLLQHQDHTQLTNYFTAKTNLLEPIIDEDTPVIQWINRIILQAIQQNASDIHFEPYQNNYRIRFRQDGILNAIESPPIILSTRIASRIKIMAQLDIAERRIPQDGRFNLYNMDCRVSVCPTIFGEKIVIRILNSSNKFAHIDTLEFNPTQKNLFLTAIQRPQGMILVTGPTGSGKTLTLYAALNYLNIPEKNIFTVEDPVEIHMQGINQVQVNPGIGRTFSTILRAFLRQDPDIIMLGEIRDFETADLAIKAAQTGHLILSTIHTNNTAQTIVRLKNLGIATFNLVNSINLIIAQRLVRRLCEKCKQQISASVYAACGCAHCIQGYHGRIAIFEIMPITNSIYNMILENRSATDLLSQAKQEGMLTLYEAGVEKVYAGITTWDEIKHITME